MTANYGNLEATLQNDLQSILSSDTTSYTFRNVDSTQANPTNSLSNLKIYYGIPIELLNRTAGIYVIVHPPEVNETWISIQGTKRKVYMTAKIEAYSERERNTSIIGGAIRNAIRTGKSTTYKDGFVVDTNYRSLMTPVQFEPGAKPWYRFTLLLRFTWSG